MSYISNPKTEADQAGRRAHYALHQVWSKAVGTRDYVKAEWRELDQAIEDLKRRAR